MKSPNQYQFQNHSGNLTAQLNIFFQTGPNKYSEDKLRQFNQTVKLMKTSYQRIQNQIKKKGKFQQNYDGKKKLKKYQDQLLRIQNKIQDAQNKYLTYQKKQLTSIPGKGGSYQMTQIDLQQKNLGRFKDLHKQALTNYQTATLTNQQLAKQGAVLNNMNVDAHGVQQQLGMVGQLMGVMQNRQLISKLILLFLAIFLALADVTILILKII